MTKAAALRKAKIYFRPLIADSIRQCFGNNLLDSSKVKEQDGDERYCIDRLYCGLSPELLDNGFCMIFQTFADDTEKGDFYAVAGYVAPIDEWKEFSLNWHSALKERPRLGFYRTSDAISLEGQFKGWSEPTRNTRVAKLASTIPIRSAYGVAAFLSKKDFEEFFVPNFFSIWGNPYYLCAVYLIQSVCYKMSVNHVPVTKLDFIFDKQGKVGTTFKFAYEKMIRPMSFCNFPFIGNVDHKDKKEFLPLQAADMHAGWVRRNKSTIRVWTDADPYLRQIQQEEFPVRRQFLERLAKYRKEHAKEFEAAWDEHYQSGSIADEK